jgi:NifU-like protein involved in Fe-S cluster formation
MWQYSDIVMDHFRSPRNVGTLESPALVGIGNLAGGPPTVEMHLRVRGDIVSEAKFKSFGCGATIAAASMLTEMVLNRRLAECTSIGQADLVQALGGLPPEKMHCADVAIAALRNAIAAGEA